MDVDTQHLQRSVIVLERRIAALLEEKADLDRRLHIVGVELEELIFARHTLNEGVRAVKAAREEPDHVRH